ncbi:MAG TPA: PQQ-binding-like beta-propeller repeat protein [Planctomycetaceae bacterium]|nr:PQQ-binding-like beta-propeller repeat protein [Planctomycetaceae bacterium]
MALAENWPQWRGSRFDGISRESQAPVKIGKSDDVAWRLPLPNRAGSTPVVWDNRILLTSPAEDDDALLLMCVSTAGQVLWKKEMGKGNHPVRATEGNLASPSPSTDGKHVWAFIGTGILGCYDFDGKEVWKFDVQSRYGKLDIAFGMTSTPVLDRDRLFLQLIHGDGDSETREAQVVCLDKATGNEIWKQPRPSQAIKECEHSYASPILYRDDQQEFLLTHGADYVIAHRLDDGRELWRCGGLQPDKYDPTLRLVSSPVAVPGLIVAPSAKAGRLVAIRPGGAGDITETQYKLWSFAPTPDVPSPLIVDGVVYLFRENSVLICLDAETGQKLYEQRLASSDGNRASPTFAAGNVYLAARNGTVTVIKAGRKFEQVWQSSLDEPIVSSPAFSSGRLYLRTNHALWAFGPK